MDFVKARREIHDLQKQIQTLQQENNALKTEIHQLKTDPKAYERPARNQLFLKKPGEIILRLPPEKEKSNSPVEEPDVKGGRSP